MQKPFAFLHVYKNIKYITLRSKSQIVIRVNRLRQLILVVKKLL